MKMWIFVNVFMMSLSLAFDVHKPLNLILTFNGIKVEIISYVLTQENIKVCLKHIWRFNIN